MPGTGVWIRKAWPLQSMRMGNLGTGLQHCALCLAAHYLGLKVPACAELCSQIADGSRWLIAHGTSAITSALAAHILRGWEMCRLGKNGEEEPRKAGRKALNDLDPEYLKDRLSPYIPLQPSWGALLVVLHTSLLASNRNWAFGVASSMLWNTLPAQILQATSLLIFRNLLKIFLCQQIYLFIFMTFCILCSIVCVYIVVHFCDILCT